MKKNSDNHLEPDAETDQQLKALFSADLADQDKKNDHVRTAISRTRFNVAKKDAVSFSLVKIWIAIAEMLAPLFAHFAAKKYSSDRFKHKSGR